MSDVTHFNAEQVANKEYEQLNPARYDFYWNADYTEVDAVKLRWWDDASYARYQGDDPGGEEDYTSFDAWLTPEVDRPK